MPLALAPSQLLQRGPRSEALAPLEVVRRLEGTERLTAIGNTVHGGNFNVVACVELHGPVTYALLHRALDEVQRNHECLRVEVVRELGTRDHYVFRRTDQKPRLEVSHDDWRTVWDRLCTEVIVGLPWRVVWNKTHLIVLFHHAITDAVSLSVFFDRVLETMARAHGGVLEIGPSRPMLATMHRAARSRWPARALLRIGHQRLFGALHTGPLIPAEPRARRWYSAFRTYEPDEVDALLSRCRAHGVTLTHALSASATLELQGRVRPDKPFTAALCTSVDLRRLVPGVDPLQMGLLSSAVHSFFPLSGGERLWPLAAEAKRQLTRAFGRDEHRDMPVVHTMLGSRMAAMLETENEGRTPDCALLVSNVGRLDSLLHGPFRAETMFVTGSQPAFGSTYILVAATVRGRLCVHLGFPTPTISIDEGESALDRIIARVFG